MRRDRGMYLRFCSCYMAELGFELGAGEGHFQKPLPPIPCHLVLFRKKEVGAGSTAHRDQS